MSLPRSKTPRGAASPAPSRASHGRASNSPAPEGKSDGTFWEKVGTLGRKKKAQEVVQVEVEGKHAIDSPGMPKSSEVPPEEYLLEENEERSMIEPKSYENPKLKDLISILIEWVNDELHAERIIVQDVEEDLYDGQVAADSGVGLTAPPLYGSPTGQHLAESRKQEHTWQHWAPTSQSYSGQGGLTWSGDFSEPEKVLICAIARI